MFRDLSPVLRDDNREIFFDREDLITVHQLTPDMEVTSAPLRAGRQIDIIGLSMSPEAIKAGLVDFTDVVGPEPALHSLHFSLSDTEAYQSFVFEPPMPFKPVENGGANELEVTIPMHQLIRSVPVDSGAEVHGILNRETGVVLFADVTARPHRDGKPSSLEWSLSGFVLAATRGR